VRALAHGRLNVETAVGQMNELLHAARFCMVASGTATVQTALFGVPMVVLYRVSPLTYLLARMLVHVQSIAMVNILAEQPFVPEFIQGRARPDIMLPTITRLIDDTPERAAMIAGLDRIRESLGAGGASENAAREILEIVEARRHD
jgi:lipid-A-disaccharide synthase